MVWGVWGGFLAAFSGDSRGMKRPVSAHSKPNKGDSQQANAKGAYASVGTPIVEDTNPPPMFHGINGEESVPLSSIVRDSVEVL